ncbi:hypothetical protein JYU19_01750 [bacterium AH-315-J21]|nr:hypothetical protein [bacterium AH-315-J21]MBN4057013.1 hypothetical protein [bacterium AH-315-J21]
MAVTSGYSFVFSVTSELETRRRADGPPCQGTNNVALKMTQWEMPINQLTKPTARGLLINPKKVASGLAMALFAVV